ncbi:Histidine kinase-, DNA gyrase B-, and HSP90-like ATPase [compost metagenome]
MEPGSRLDYTKVSVIDDGPGMDREKLRSLYAVMRTGHVSSATGHGIGIVNVERRLRLSYDTATDGLDIKSEKGQGTTVTFEIPNEYGSDIERENDTHRG